jgi:hypothetical protein
MQRKRDVSNSDHRGARHNATLRLWYRAELLNFETDEVFDDLSAIHRCVGVHEHTGFESLHFGDPVLALPINAVVAHDQSYGLGVVIEVPLSRAPTPKELDNIRSVIDEGMFRGWGTNYDFEIPEDLSQTYRVQFDAQPSHQVVVDA